jgi:lysylphosphatidylglycerol synthetase-like protein (DUF2156 family)
MRKALDALYRAALIGACLAMIVIVILVFAQVLGRVTDRIAVFFGMGRYGFIVPSLARPSSPCRGRCARPAMCA